MSGVTFFGFLRGGEFTVPSAEAYDRERHLLPEDVSTDSVRDPSFVKVRIKQSVKNGSVSPRSIDCAIAHTELYKSRRCVTEVPGSSRVPTRPAVQV